MVLVVNGFAGAVAMLPSFTVTWWHKTRAPWGLPSRCGENVVAKMGGIILFLTEVDGFLVAVIVFPAVVDGFPAL